jgi:anti-sigma B factor antagonist
MPSTLEIHERRGSDEIVLALQGELDLCSGAELAERLADAADSGARVVVDLTELEFMDPAGMGVLHRAALRAGEESWTLDLTGPRPNVRRLLRLTALA